MKPNQAIPVLEKLMTAKLPVLLTGAPGVGKSDIVEQARLNANCDLILSHPAVADPTDAKGLPWPDAQNNVANFLPFGDLKKALTATKPTVWFLDDLGQASPAVQASYMQLLLARRVNDHVLPDCVTFVAATNRRQDRAGVAGLLEPVKSRFVTIIGIEPDLDSWCMWAYKNGMPVELIAFLRLRESEKTPMLHVFEPSAELVNSRSPRTWASVGKLYNNGIMDLDKDIALEVFGGAVGSAPATEFVGFVDLFRQIPNPDAVLLNPHNAAIPDGPSVLYALVSALVSRVTEANFGRFSEYAQRMFDKGHGEFSTLMVRDALNVAPEIQHSPDFVKFMMSDLGKTLN